MSLSTKLKLSMPFLLLLLFLSSPFLTYAQSSEENVTKRTGWGADEKLSSEDDNQYMEINKINLVVLDSNTLAIRKDCNNWTRSLYYYLTTRLGLIDIPFSYVICPDGNILEASKFGVEKKFGIVDGNKALNVLMLNYPLLDSFDKETYLDKVEPFLLQKANTLVLNKIEIKQLKVKVNTKEKSVSLSLIPYTKENIFTSTIAQTTTKISPKKKVLRVTLDESVVTNTNTKGNDLVDVKLTITNNSGFNIYGSGDNTLNVVTNNPFDQKSEFYAGGDYWISLSRIALLKENDILKDKEKKEYTFKIKTPLKSGSLTQDFVISNSLGEKISSTEFKTTITNTLKGLDIIEILPTDVGKLNVRDTPNGKTVLTKVFPKDRFVVQERKEGWIAIDVSGTKGWIISRYTKAVTQ